ncbi:tumor necrosis factor alpha-induced protein 3 isoform X2 [Patella vulgata]|uniref:tumor necrosis factor alpha-induced protein 3 isoform X2 n=1 Tax=Patella vulgata TaxID=6465 RepID=UPI0024A7F1A3|nr:tumor necrosis factor alpha-induced protein 3 isoform X2 [Patella vulgata]
MRNSSSRLKKMEPLFKRLEDSNSEKVKKIKKKILENVDYTRFLTIVNFSFFTTILPSLRSWHDEFRVMIEKAVIDCDMKVDLEQSKVINWCRISQSLYPLNTLRDGNCLLHAISTYIWGIQDTGLILRRLLHTTLVNDPNNLFKYRFIRYKQSQVWSDLIRFTEENWNMEWQYIVDSAKSKENASFGNPHLFLEPIHIYVMANILRRPIVVMADEKIRTFGERMSMQENDIGGIYLPLNVPPESCCKFPIILGFTLSHFCPLINCKESASSSQKPILPLLKSDLSQLPLKFLSIDEEPEVANLLSIYLNLIEIDHTSGGNTIPISSAKIGSQGLSEDLSVVDDYFRDCERKYRAFLNGEEAYPIELPPFRQEAAQSRTSPLNNMMQSNETPRTVPSSNLPNVRVSSGSRQTRYYGIGDGSPSPETMHYFQNRKCITPGCRMYGSAATGNMCSTCLKRYTEENAGPPSIYYIPQDPSAPPPSFPLTQTFQHPTMMTETCQGPDCRFHASTDTSPYCHECYNHLLPNRQVSQNSSNTEEKRRLSVEMETPIYVGNSSSSSGDTELFGSGESTEQLTRHQTNQRKGKVQNILQECITQGCRGKGSPGQSGKCSKCYVECGSGKHAAANTSQQPIEEMIGRQFEMMEATGNSASSGHHISRKHICSTPGCEGIRQKNVFDMCFKCFDKADAKKTSTQRQNASRNTEHAATSIQEFGQNVGNMEENVVESSTPTNAIVEPKQVSCMDDASTQCASPMCDNPVYPPAKLCQSCLDVLRKNQAGKSAGCKTVNCKFHGAPEFGGYCSSCFKHRSPRKVNSAPIARRNMYPVEEQLVEKRNTSPFIRRSQPSCIVEACVRYGDPTLNGMCTHCYNLNHPLSAPIVGASNLHIGQQPSIPVQEGYGFVPNPSQSQSFLESIQRVEGSRKVSKLCKASNCNNYGNASCEGFCNNCYKIYKRQFKNPAMHLLERNG